ncbi:hypothetical protein PtA15_14A372 [Puccinia triticina]|uniref:Secreted protein n=1 Tax=Puccinia triticina TaxID=208348 RepID=A0ABY7D2Z4_9BASI|nr:uncharacterized protein PtA15_14A372 [Puccinia triticina]WAQ91488.1 hypothetical protein PtA15_14A372 [Puccinia triticina]
MSQWLWQCLLVLLSKRSSALTSFPESTHFRQLCGSRVPSSSWLAAVGVRGCIPFYQHCSGNYTQAHDNRPRYPIESIFPAPRSDWRYQTSSFGDSTSQAIAYQPLLRLTKAGIRKPIAKLFQPSPGHSPSSHKSHQPTSRKRLPAEISW